MTRHEIRLCGFGGQGIALMGKILGSAFSVFGNRHSVTTQSYGPESRGGASASNIVVSDDVVDYPYVIEPEVFICMSKEAYTKYIDSLRPGGLFIYEEDLVPVDDRMKKAGKIYKLPATTIAEKELGRRIVANIVMLGFFAELNDLIDKETLLKSTLRMVPPRFKALNEKAFKLGVKYAQKAKPLEVTS
ncbi:MAG: 2-oxoacid:acceptor oxidoreductase family protein [Candidatus Heimdallarchaeota archaeon]|nr:MAG: 2-oxoacid:ferredoxin oxidoreductase subunit gamma [Candidatus Gerdarchaeota archaeon]RLI72315.1 MAG: 2-oxoacid:ferredoxin oxidoreductase subunit gamma [Candidatus Gerdarchaeota archaeon]RLI73225.1 MAG: 2-oxoacid:ferredoxin oxidoreductase subunit gamma [Candidatus Heimdallarchaeota archaeon]